MSIYALDADEAINIPIGNAIRLCIIPGTGATVTYSPVDNTNATAHDTDNDTAVTARTTVDVDWPIYRVSTTGGAARVAVV